MTLEKFTTASVHDQVDELKNAAWECFSPKVLFFLFYDSGVTGSKIQHNGKAGTGPRIFHMSSTVWLSRWVLRSVCFGYNTMEHQAYYQLLRTGLPGFLCQVFFLPSMTVLLRQISIKWQCISRQLILETSNCWHCGNMAHKATNKIVRTLLLGNDYLLFRLGQSHLTTGSQIVTSNAA